MHDEIYHRSTEGGFKVTGSSPNYTICKKEKETFCLCSKLLSA